MTVDVPMTVRQRQYVTHAMDVGNGVKGTTRQHGDDSARGHGSCNLGATFAVDAPIN